VANDDLLGTAVSSFGRLHIMVNKAGISTGLHTPSWTRPGLRTRTHQRQRGLPAFLATAMVRPFLEDPDLNKALPGKSPWPNSARPVTHPRK